MKFHPTAAMFPMMRTEEFAALVQDLRSNGLIEPIWIYKQQILDGRNRFNACTEAGIEPAFREWNGTDPLAFVISENLRRRHLDAGRRAAIAVKRREGKDSVLDRCEAEAKERQRQGKTKVSDPGQARRKAAAMFQVAESYIQDAKLVRQADPNLLERVVEGEIQLSEAKREILDRRRAARRAENEAKVEEYAAGTLEELIESGAKFSTIVIDPPWTPEDSGIQSVMGRSDPLYKTESIEEIAARPVPELADKDCHLYVWATNRTLRAAFELLDHWEFRFVTALVWVKPHFGMGNYFRVQHEHVLFGVHGSLPLKRKDAGTVIEADNSREHSVKPAEFFTLVESCSHAPYLELYGREARENWIVWGEDGVLK